ncbi:hypothetical protein A3C89_02210 [Candidatus Kaiserbacteria bacterium RIFCSPHIGHO2_02_FULL_50_50]|uniref:HIT domain-containing protein n=1 Tax=Candidatus Kaiserbacteria bacterium RIFCSPHIGHO2_02_FULL_50_50 TaxID=1798492 RepID=A0A1F6DFK7_9BACT|nr:MAG: hypothetical protein A3C89_02210 [Candidatus Kaiserbacteria bacterium RIFCSPHIGHO2_02_FULL_50_50]OGG88613.1 MAG: hypothetical protein A3G62_00755 [Candidatus Kaiserbacteria bacterium RIFCSPLOWO2_12_FULL_50_10]
MEETVFDKIVRGEIPAHIIYEDDATVAFLDMTPVHKGHTLVVPKARCRNILDCPSETVGRVYQTAQKVAQHMKQALGADGVNVHGNNEPAAGQEVFYFHVHVIPRYENAQPFQKPTHEVYADGEMKAFAEKLSMK